MEASVELDLKPIPELIKVKKIEYRERSAIEEATLVLGEATIEQFLARRDIEGAEVADPEMELDLVIEHLVRVKVGIEIWWELRSLKAEEARQTGLVAMVMTVAEERDNFTHAKKAVALSSS